MIRYLKVIMKSKDQNELYCTLTHVQVFGRSMHLSLVESFKDVNIPPVVSEVLKMGLPKPAGIELEVIDKKQERKRWTPINLKSPSTRV